jgi:Putative MetA-pathway of phenol degradation
MAKIYFLISMWLFCSLPGIGQDKIDTDRPDQSESTVNTPPHYFQAEFGFSKENLYGRDYDLIHPAVLLKYGLKKIELRLETSFKTSYQHLIPDPVTTTGIDPVAIGIRAPLWEEKKWIPKTSLLVHLGIPALGSKAFRPDHLFPSFRFAMQNSITKNFGIGYNLGAEWDGYSSTPSWIYTLTTGFDLSEKWYAYAEIFGSFRKNEAAQHNLDGGFGYTINKDLKVDISGGFGISEAAPKSYVATGFSFRINTMKKK